MIIIIVIIIIIIVVIIIIIIIIIIRIINPSGQNQHTHTQTYVMHKSIDMQVRHIPIKYQIISYQHRQYSSLFNTSTLNTHTHTHTHTHYTLHHHTNNTTQITDWLTKKHIIKHTYNTLDNTCNTYIPVGEYGSVQTSVDVSIRNAPVQSPIDHRYDECTQAYLLLLLLFLFFLHNKHIILTSYIHTYTYIHIHTHIHITLRLQNVPVQRTIYLPSIYLPTPTQHNTTQSYHNLCGKKLAICNNAAYEDKRGC